MPTKTTPLALFVACCALTAPALFAQPAANRGAAPALAVGPALPTIESLTTTLNLTPAQVATIGPLLAEVATAQQNLTGLRDNVTQLRAGLSGKLGPVLTDAQKPQLAALLTPPVPARGGGARAGGTPNYSSVVPAPPGTSVDWASRLDWDLADLKVFHDANAKLAPPASGEDRVVFIGDSITANWQNSFNRLFPGKPYIGRGYTSETTAQMLIRFRPDVIDLQPKVVVILAGTNDIAGNLGRSTDKMIQDNFISMIDLAAMSKIKVVLCSIMPTTRYFWQPTVTDGAQRVVVINKWLKAYAATRPGDVLYVDIHTPMKAADSDGMNPQLSGDGTHPNATGYALISPLVQTAIEQILAQK